ncbi:isopeptide-forming domain-containing fimbrial protein [Bifidobacterium sp. ESL0732]|uniref:isopeptide-forming domain-containing fimbrial protein n=1 Tax=Bifidobacterium sp. ESL0732 TaxID=2983222 RepID=UPI0023F93BB2|nr:isopeptide-forming domain-containing fimbrial protein [Bifidobacterium sp. ESL0732]WEV63903.1 isopeptide-forming domain-containing fimbrial protein [Bifidobacterium sp. ESL0732]
MLFDKTIRRAAGVALTAATLLALAPFGVANAAGQVDVSTKDAGRITMPTKNQETIAIHGETAAMAGHSFAAVRIGTYAYASASGDKLSEIGVETDGQAKDLAQSALDGVIKPADQDAKYKGNPVGEVASKWLGYHSDSVASANKDEVSNSGTKADAWGRDGNLRKFVTALAKAEHGTTHFSDLVKKATATKPEDVQTDSDTSKSTVTISGLAPGLYVVEDVTGEATSASTKSGANSNSIPMLVGTGITIDANTKYTQMADMRDPLGSIEMKSYNPTIDKKIVSTDASIGGTVKYQLTGQVPLTTGFDHFIYTMVDKPGKGLTYKQGSEKVTINGHDVDAQTGTAKGYTVKTGASSADGRTGDTDFIDFDLSSVITDQQYIWEDSIVVTYEMTVNDNADENDGLSNGVSLSYSNDVNDQTKNAAATAGDGGAVNSGAANGSVASVSPTDGGTGAKIHFRHFSLLNADKLNGTVLTGATFTIKSVSQGASAQDDSENISFRKLADGSYKKVVAPQEGDTTVSTTLSTSSKGKITVTGLGEGVYEIAQTKEATDYSHSFLPDFQVKLSVDDTTPRPSDAKVTSDVQFQVKVSKGDFWGLTSKDVTTPFTDGIHEGKTVNWAPAESVVESADNTNAIVVCNVTSISQLPMTGGAGAILALLVVVALMLATALLITARRKIRE